MIEKLKRPDCNSCYYFSKSDFNETEGYCKIRKEHLNPHEGEECEQFADSFVEDCPFRGNNEQYCPYYGKYCECDEDEQKVCGMFSAYKDKMTKLLDTRAIKPEKYAELREQDFDTWLDTILHEIIEQVNFDASEVDALGGAVWNGECPDGTPYPKQCAREDAYIQCIRQSNQLDVHNAKLEFLDDKIDALKDLFEDLKTQINNLSFILNPAYVVKKIEHTGSDFCGNCTHCHRGKQADDAVCVCELSHKTIDPDDSSCTMFEHPF